MGYALFSQRKLLIVGMLNNYQMQQAQRADEQFMIATEQTQLKQQLSSQSAAQSGELAELYECLADAGDSDERNSINALISASQERFKQETDAIQREVTEVTLKEQRLEMEVKNLDTKVTKLQKELETIEQAESQGIERAMPKFSGLG